MHNSNLLQILRSFSKRDTTEFEWYIKSPYFNSSQNIINLYTYLKKYMPELKNSNLDKEIVYKKVFKTNLFNRGLMNSLMFKLTNLAKGYLAHIYLKSQPVEEKKFMLEELLKRNVDKVFEKEYSETMDILNSANGIEDSYFSQKLILGAMYNNFHEAKSKITNKLKDDLEKSSEYLLCYFILVARVFIEGEQIRKQKSNIEIKGSLLNDFINSLEIESYLEKIQDMTSPEAITVRLNLLNILINLNKYENNIQLYDKYKDMINRYHNLFSKRELFCLYTTSRNIIKFNLNLSYNKYLDEYFDILKKMLRDNAFIIYGENMTLSFFDNYINTAIELNKINEADEFIESNISRLVPEIRSNVERYAKAKIAFLKKDYGKSLQLANSSQIEPISQKTELKILQIKIFFELSDFESALSSIDSLRHFLKNNKSVSSKRRSDNIAFCRVVSRLISLKSKLDEVKLEELRNFTLQTGSIPSKNWLLDKISEFKNK